MTDESVISLVKLQVKKLDLGGFRLCENLDEGIMISNLPLLFADGYPTCLEKVTLVSIRILFVRCVCCSIYRRVFTLTSSYLYVAPFQACLQNLIAPMSLSNTSAQIRCTCTRDSCAGLCQHAACILLYDVTQPFEARGDFTCRYWKACCLW